MKTIEERLKSIERISWMDPFRYETIQSLLTELAADLQAEKEKEVAELRKTLEEKDAMSATIAQQDALLEEAKRVLAIAQPDVCYMVLPGETNGRKGLGSRGRVRISPPAFNPSRLP